MCDICRHDPCVSQCPNYVPPRTDRYCDVCGQGIYEGEEYVRNDEGKYMHFECVQSLRDLLEWLGYDVRYMDE